MPSMMMAARRAFEAIIGKPRRPKSHVEFQEQLLASVGGRWFDFEGIIRDAYKFILRPGDTCLDIGANVGAHTFQMAQFVGENGHVIAVEAAPPLYQSLTHDRSTQYPQLSKRVTLHNVAISDCPGKLDFYFAKDCTGLSGLRQREVLNGYETEVFKVQAMTLDHLLSDCRSKIVYAKIDIEGAEIPALRAASRLFKDRAILSIEHNNDSSVAFNCTGTDLLNILHRHSYHLFDLFGYEYPTDEHIKTSLIWDYIALPTEYRKSKALFSHISGSYPTGNNY